MGGALLLNKMSLFFEFPYNIKIKILFVVKKIYEENKKEG